MAPDFIEHKLNSDIYNQLIKKYEPLRGQPDVDLNTVSKKYYYKMVPSQDNLITIASNNTTQTCWCTRNNYGLSMSNVDCVLHSNVCNE